MRRGGWGPDPEPAGMTDEEAAARAVVDPDAFALLYRRYVDGVYGFCAWRLAGREAAEDATALVFTKALAGLPGYQPGRGAFRPWLFAIAYRVVVDAHRGARPELPINDALDLADPNPTGDPAGTALSAETARTVRAAIAHLPEDQRAIVTLRLAGLSGQEIAQTVGRSLAAVKFAQFRAYQRLRLLLAEPGAVSESPVAPLTPLTVTSRAALAERRSAAWPTSPEDRRVGP